MAWMELDPLWSADALRDKIRAELFSLRGLLSYLEDRERIGLEEYLYCQTKIHQVLKHLKRIERTIGAGPTSG